MEKRKAMDSTAKPRILTGDTPTGRLQENIGAVSVRLSPAEISDLETAASKIPVQGARYPENLQKMVGR